jgi:hypothetical protein
MTIRATYYDPRGVSVHVVTEKHDVCFSVSGTIPGRDHGCISLRFATHLGSGRALGGAGGAKVIDSAERAVRALLDSLATVGAAS